MDEIWRVESHGALQFFSASVATSSIEVNCSTDMDVEWTSCTAILTALGMLWCGEVWCGVVRYGEVWCDAVHKESGRHRSASQYFDESDATELFHDSSFPFFLAFPPSLSTPPPLNLPSTLHRERTRV